MKKPHCFSAFELLRQGNSRFLKGEKSKGSLSPAIRAKTAENGQTPYAVVLTCSDSRVPPEHIFSAGIGELFVVRNAGNLVSDFVLGSIEYAVSALGARAIVVMGHSKCGAISAAIQGHSDGYFQTIIDSITPAISGETNHEKCVKLNVLNSIEKIKQSEIVQKLLNEGKLEIFPAVYNIETGKVDFFLDTQPLPTAQIQSLQYGI